MNEWSGEGAERRVVTGVLAAEQALRRKSGRPEARTVQLRPSLAKDGFDVTENGGPLVGVELHDLTNKNRDRVTRVGIRGIRAGRNPTRPGGKSFEVQAVEFSEVEEDDRIGLLDHASLDLGQVRVGPAYASFDLSERELVVHARAPQDAANLWAALSTSEIRLNRRPRSR